MDQLSSLGTIIADTIPPTVQLYIPLLSANATAIHSTARTTHHYGPHPRQELDVYTPSSTTTSTPILLFIHGGGLVRGAKNLDNIPGDLVYTNLGHFFALHGYITVAINYRLVGTHSAQFPSGGEDVALAVKWIAANYSGAARPLFLLGNSAGGVHAATYLFGEQFKDVLEEVTGKGDGVRLRGVAFSSTPFGFAKPAPQRLPVLEAYYGDAVEKHSPTGLLGSVGGEQMGLLERGDVRFNVLASELDPEDEIWEIQKPFIDLLRKKRGEAAVQVTDVAGHNHISPMLSLGTGQEKEEAWGVSLVQWMDRLQK